jgi:hypothetical protein
MGAEAALGVFVLEVRERDPGLRGEALGSSQAGQGLSAPVPADLAVLENRLRRIETGRLRQLPTKLVTSPVEARRRAVGGLGGRTRS